jgi:hypothetical protein
MAPAIKAMIDTRPQRLTPASVAKENREPFERERLRRKPQISVAAEGQHTHDHDRRDHDETGDADVEW